MDIRYYRNVQKDRSQLKDRQKYVDNEDFSFPPLEPPQEEESKLDPYKPLIDSWLLADKKAPRRQRHIRQGEIHKRLQEEAEVFQIRIEKRYSFVVAFILSSEEFL